MRFLRPAYGGTRKDGTLWMWAAALAVVVVDAGLKFFARTFLPRAGIELVPIVSLRVVDNVRGPFGLGPLWLTVAASIIVFVILGRSRFLPSSHASTLRARAGFALLIGGGLSNLAERLAFGRTTDLLELGRLTALNLADVAILVGVVLVLSPTKMPPTQDGRR